MDRFLPHIELLQEYYRSRGIAFGSQEDLIYFAQKIGEADLVQEELASILRSVLYAEDLALERTELLALLCASLNGGNTAAGPGEFHVASRELILFINRTMRSLQHGWMERPGDLTALEPASVDADSQPPSTSPWQELPFGQDLQEAAVAYFPTDRLGYTGQASAARVQENGSRKSLSTAIREATERQFTEDAHLLDDAPQEQPSRQPATYAQPFAARAEAPRLATPKRSVPIAARWARLRQPAVWCSAAALAGFGLGALLPRSGPTVTHSAQVLPSGPEKPPAARDVSVASPLPAAPASSKPAAVAAAPAASAGPSTCVLLSQAGHDPALNSLPTLSSTVSGVPIPLIPTSTACGLVVTAPAPVYPTLASLTQLRGDVSLEVVISPQGRVTVGHVLSGPALLRGAAEEAVRQWRFRPYLQDGHAIEVATPVTLAFRPPPSPETPDTGSQEPGF